jgi:hypothetical protein
VTVGSAAQSEARVHGGRMCSPIRARRHAQGSHRRAQVKDYYRLKRRTARDRSRGVQQVQLASGFQSRRADRSARRRLPDAGSARPSGGAGLFEGRGILGSVWRVLSRSDRGRAVIQA